MTHSLLAAQTFLSALPEEIPIFPLSGAVLLPHARLPMNVSEPRYMNMIEDALGRGRLIGMIQPSSDVEAENPRLYSIGCVGRMTSFNEVDDGHFLIVLSGLCRFRVVAEYPRTKPYRIVRPEWTPFPSDLGEDEPVKVDREKLTDLMRSYFKKNAISVDWNVVKNAPDEVLIPTIIMICPFAPNEKQALLEAKTLTERTSMLMALLEMASLPQADNEAEIKH